MEKLKHALKDKMFINSESNNFTAFKTTNHGKVLRGYGSNPATLLIDFWLDWFMWRLFWYFIFPKI